MKRYSFPKSARLLKQKHFRDVSKFGKQQAGKFLLIHCLKNASFSSSKLGITVSRKFGKAPSRNHFKRLVREAFRLLRPAIAHPVYLNVRPREAAHQVTLQDIQQELSKVVELIEPVS